MSNSITLSHAKKLRFLRKTYDRKQAEIAEALNMSQQAYSKLEKGDTIFTDATIERIASFFEITPAEFERSMESIYIGDNNINTNNSNTGSNTSNVDMKLFEALQKSHEQNTALLHLLLEEKDKFIKHLQSAISQ